MWVELPDSLKDCPEWKAFCEGHIKNHEMYARFTPGMPIIDHNGRPGIVIDSVPDYLDPDNVEDDGTGKRWRQGVYYRIDGEKSMKRAGADLLKPFSSSQSLAS